MAIGVSFNTHAQTPSPLCSTYRCDFFSFRKIYAGINGGKQEKKNHNPLRLNSSALRSLRTRWKWGMRIYINSRRGGWRRIAIDVVDGGDAGSAWISTSRASVPVPVPAPSRSGAELSLYIKMAFPCRWNPATCPQLSLGFNPRRERASPGAHPSLELLSLVLSTNPHCTGCR